MPMKNASEREVVFMMRTSCPADRDCEPRGKLFLCPCALHLKMPMLALCFGDFEGGAGVENPGNAIGNFSINRAVVRVQQVTHSQLLVLFNHNGLAAA